MNVYYCLTCRDGHRRVSTRNPFQHLWSSNGFSTSATTISNGVSIHVGFYDEQLVLETFYREIRIQRDIWKESFLLSFQHHPKARSVQWNVVNFLGSISEVPRRYYFKKTLTYYCGQCGILSKGVKVEEVYRPEMVKIFRHLDPTPERWRSKLRLGKLGR